MRKTPLLWRTRVLAIRESNSESRKVREPHSTGFELKVSGKRHDLTCPMPSTAKQQ
jgi:hypothetical protein